MFGSLVQFTWHACHRHSCKYMRSATYHVFCIFIYNDSLGNTNCDAIKTAIFGEKISICKVEAITLYIFKICVHSYGIPVLPNAVAEYGLICVYSNSLFFLQFVYFNLFIIRICLNSIAMNETNALNYAMFTRCDYGIWICLTMFHC